jgi:class 3 adenylate cyclase/tetratricopeptide (TPR) repeat protein
VCGSSFEDGAHFCSACGSPVSGRGQGSTEERKAVTALFCDLVGFTAASESADPEDVDRVLGAYFGVARAQIEGHGGVVEKFIGDAVVGIFGVPAAHEDDPERAVRAGLRIVEEAENLVAIGGGPLRVRVGVNTGPVLVRLGVAPGSGRGFVAGDAVNTASRLQSIAPEMSVVVGDATHSATAQVFDYVELDSRPVKGKSGRVRVFRAIQPRARFGTDITRTHTSPFVGREVDLALLKGMFDKAVAGQSVQLVTVVGEPGLGKSRIVGELLSYVDNRPELVIWRQGRCLPYGEGVTFWALGEIVKAHAGILESDPPDVAVTRLDVVLPAGPQRAWLRQRLLPLLGIEASSSAGREELFTAWRLFLEHLAETAPAVLVFEDLHWADEAMLAFITYLADRVEGLPMLLVGTGRPDLFGRHPDYTSALSNANRVNLAPLSATEMARLVSALSVTALLPAQLQQAILDRVGGNPLYAEEFVRLLNDERRGAGTATELERSDGGPVPFPNSVQSLIAARLDTIDPDAKSLLADAAVLGKIFWAGAVAAMGGRDADAVTELLRELSRKELIRRARRSTIDGEAEYAFWHVLTRDVAYNQIPRADRADRHVAAAAWLESVAGERVEDVAEVLAHHYTTAIELAEAAVDPDLAARLQVPALRFLTLAGDRALGLDTTAALTDYGRALALTPPDHPQRATILARYGDAIFQAGRFGEAAEALEEAVAIFERDGDAAAAARALGILAAVLYMLGDARGWALPSVALALLEALPPGPALVAALSERSRTEALQGRHEAAIGYADQSLTLAGEFGMDPPARAFAYRGLARALIADRAGLADMREAIAVATEAGEGRDAALFHNNLGMAAWVFDGPEPSLEIISTGITFARSRGLAGTADAGRLDEALDLAGSLAAGFETSGNIADLIMIRAAEARVRVLRGHPEEAADRLDWLVVATRETNDPQHLASGLGSAALTRAALGDARGALALLTELEASPGTHGITYYAALLPAMVRTALALGSAELAERLIDGVQTYPYGRHSLVTAHAALAEVRGDLDAAAAGHADAARRWAELGVVPERAFALLGHGRAMVALNRSASSREVLEQAAAVFRRLGAMPALAEIDALLG